MAPHLRLVSLIVLLAASAMAAAAPGQGKPAAKGDPAVPAGHSLHGEAFNEGPRQRAYLMGGTGHVHIAVTTRSADAQAFFDQGVGQLHGFWYFEAERSFRQVAALDPDCAMAYWGMAMANVNNTDRARGFIRKAVERKPKVSRREQLWIDAYAAYWTGGGNPQFRRPELVHRLEDISYEFPKELEAKAFLAFQIYDNSHAGLALVSRQAVAALIEQVLAAEPMHPAHHFMIHLWDEAKPIRALESAARCGQGSPNVAHMWHMPGHIYSDLHRYADAAWQQEASARVDHRHMMQDHYLPDQIHNYAHNNQWLIQDLEYIGRAHDAVALAKNMIELPRHPRYNTLGWGSSAEGRRRLIETLTKYELWDELISLSKTMYLEPLDGPEEQLKRLRLLGVAYFSKGDVPNGRQQIQGLESMVQRIKVDEKAAGDRAEAEARKQKQPAARVAQLRAAAVRPFANKARPVEAVLTELRGYAFLAQGNAAKAAPCFEHANDMTTERRARLWLELGQPDKACQLAREAVAGADQQVQPLANYIDILYRSGKLAEAKEQFARLRPLSAQVDLDVPVMRRLAPVAKALGLPADWRAPKVTPSDVGRRPDLKDLGPLRWQPMPAADWSLPDEHGKRVSLKDYRGRPVIVIFFLGTGCPHCIEQLNAFQPMVREFAAAGITLVAVSTDSVQGLRATFEKTRWPAELALVSDHELKTFRAYRAFDDFEQRPLHGTFLIDADGLVRWQDISYEPFKETRFLLDESKRLLGLPRSAGGERSVRADARAQKVAARRQ
jgi:peroxiredoxin/Tfp pilus assembly protein PilF